MSSTNKKEVLPPPAGFSPDYKTGPTGRLRGAENLDFLEPETDSRGCTDWDDAEAGFFGND